jgi:hypothetical protein
MSDPTQVDYVEVPSAVGAACMQPLISQALLALGRSLAKCSDAAMSARRHVMLSGGAALLWRVRERLLDEVAVRGVQACRTARSERRGMECGRTSSA